MTTDAQLFLQQHLIQQTQSIAHYDWNGQTVWIKKDSAQNPLWLYQLGTLLCRLFQLNVLAPIPSLGGQKGIETEIHRINTLHCHNINVPQLLATAPDGFMIADLGTHTQRAQQLDTALLHCQDTHNAWLLFTKAVDAIAHVHQNQMWLSEAFARNMMIDGQNNIAFLDFETDPSHHFPINQCFARDWLFFMYSIAIRLKNLNLLAKGTEYLKQQLMTEPKETQQTVYTACKKLSFIKSLPINRLGGDGRRAKIVAEMFDLISHY